MLFVTRVPAQSRCVAVHVVSNAMAHVNNACPVVQRILERVEAVATRTRWPKEGGWSNTSRRDRAAETSSSLTAGNRVQRMSCRWGRKRRASHARHMIGSDILSQDKIHTPTWGCTARFAMVMSSQGDQGVSFSIVPEENRQHFRLLELPPELLEILTTNESNSP
jgi:hypothetical protein